MTTPRAEPISRMDRQWLGAGNVGIVGPLEVPGLGDLRSAFVALAQEGARTRLGYTISEDRRFWHFDADALVDLADRVVTEVPGVSFDDTSSESEIVAAANALLAEHQPDGSSIGVIRAGDYLLYQKDHAIGDAPALLYAATGLVQVARTGQLPRWVAEELSEHPLRAALTNTFGRGRQPLAPLIRDRLIGSAPTRYRPDHHPRAELMAPQLSTLYAVHGSQGWQHVKEWRRDHATEASMASIYVVLARRALRAAGLDLTADTTVLYDCRRNLPAGAHVRGNFVVGFCHEFADDPTRVGDDITATATSGRALLTLASSVLRGRRAVLPSPGPVNVVPSQSHLAFVFAPRNRDVEMLPWRRQDVRGFGVTSPTAGLADVSLSMLLVRGRLSVSWSFHSNVVPSAVIVEANRLIDEEPLRLLNRPVTA